MSILSEALIKALIGFQKPHLKPAYAGVADTELGLECRSSCSGTCDDSCRGSCEGDCAGSCDGSCIGGCKNTIGYSI